MPLKLDGRQYSPALVERIVVSGGSCKSFVIAAKMLKLLSELELSPRTVNEMTVKIGRELESQRDTQTERYQHRLLTEPATVGTPPVAIACVGVDGGRMQTRTPGRGPGVHDPHWRESKNAGFYRMTGECFEEDPHPELPSCFSSRKRLQGLLAGLEETEEQGVDEDAKPDFSWRPKSRFRTCLSSLCTSERFGRLMAAEADQRGFFSAERKAFLGDGLPYNWSIQQKCFGSFVAILDFIHPVERLHETSRALWEQSESAWHHCQKWIDLCWQGDVEEVIGLLQAEQQQRGEPDDSAPEGDPRRLLVETIGYLRNNAFRMDYPRYRTEGLPITSCLIESQIKEMNHRVKGSEKFWNDGPEGEAILQVRAALISDDDRLSRHIAARPGSPFARPSRKPRQTLPS